DEDLLVTNHGTESRVPCVAATIQGVHYHVGIVTRDLDEAMSSVGALLGLTWAAEEPIVVQPALRDANGPVGWELKGVVHSMGGPMRVELLEGGPGSVWETDQQAVLHHVAYWVDDIAATATRLQADGWTLEVTTDSGDGDFRPSMFAYVTKPGNARME